MRSYDCEFENDVLAAALQSRLPDRVDPQLRDHIAGCPICSEVALVAGALEADHSAARASAAVPDWSSVWWRAQLRARREDAQEAGKPITAVQLVAFGATVAVLGACFGATSSWFQSTLVRLGGLLRSVPVASIAADHFWLVLALGAVLIVIPAAALTMLRD